MKYYIIKSMMNEGDCYWCREEQKFTTFYSSTLYDIKGDAEWEMVEKASYVMPCHLIEFYLQSN